MSFKKINPKQNFPELEKAILEFWKKNKIFEKSLEKNKDKEKFIFYEGPPTANGKPGIHHVLARAFKDLIPRYKTMKGYFVGRRAGWDTHGLPVEIEVEKALGLSGKKEIENYGIEKFNKICRESVWRYKEDWERLTERIGFWIDLKNPYITYENDYIEKVWGILKDIWDKDLIYKGFKVVPYCPRCGTTLSSHEVAQGYKNIEDQSIYVKFKVQSSMFKVNTYLLTWTTTPWTLPGNIALAVGRDIDYVQIKNDGEELILAKEAAEKLFKNAEVVKEFKGAKLAGKEYEPLFNAKNFIKEPNEKNYKIWKADFVSTKEGTGIVHIAPAFGEDDMSLQSKVGFSMPVTVNEEGKMLFKIGKDKFVKDADQDIKEDLKKRGLLFKEETIKHDYPFCWRCDSILIYYAKSTWFIAMSKLRNKLIENNEKINWIPAYIKEGRFGGWLSEAKDWALSRERYWGTPLPIWQCDCGSNEFIGSINELKEKASSDIPKDLDLHKPFIDKIKIKCPKCGKESLRVPEVIDCWFDSGSMPFASGEFEQGNYPADFISEAIDQTRGWFYTLLAISTLLDKKSSYKNVICLGHVLDEKGKKMSKSKGNVIDPWDVINLYGADSLRWFFFTVNQPGDSKRMSKESAGEVLRKFNLLLWNVYNFFITYANTDSWTPKDYQDSKNILDRWILSRFNNIVIAVEKDLDEYNITSAARSIQSFNQELSTWYLRRSRNRRDQEFYSTLYKVLIELSKFIAPFVPFLAEAIYQNLKKKSDPESIHLCDWPCQDEVDKDLLENMEKVKNLVEQAHALRGAKKIKTRQPLTQAKIKYDLNKELLGVLKDEINVKEIFVDKEIKTDIVLDTKITAALQEEGNLREIIRQIQDLRKKANLLPSQKIDLYFDTSPKIKSIFDKNSKIIKNKTSLNNIKAGKLAVEIESTSQIDGQSLWLGVKK